MIVCARCGHENGNNETFCQNPDCHAFLEWEGGSAPAGLHPKVLPAEPAGDRAGVDGGDGAGVDGGDSTELVDPGAGTRKGDQGPAPVVGGHAERPVARPGQRQPETAPGRPAARPPVAPRTPGPPAGESPAQKPAEPQRQVAEQARPSGPILELGQPAAGDHARGHSERGRALRRLAVVLAVFVVLAVGMVAGSRLLRQDRGGGTTTSTSGPGPAKTFAQVKAAKVEASSESGSRKAALLVDGKPDTYWSRLPTDQFATLSFSFAEPVRLGRIAIAAGAAGGEFKLRHRPKTLELAFSDGSTLTKALADQPKFQDIDFPPRPVERVTMKITEVFQAPKTGQNYRRTSISEVRFFSAT